MNRKITKIIILCVTLIVLTTGGVGLYFYFNQSQAVGKIEFGKKYYLSEIRETERFAGAKIDASSYFEIKHDQKTGVLYLAGLTATSKPIPFIVTNYKESAKETVIDFEYILGNGEETKIEHLRAISTETCIYITNAEKHNVQYIIGQNPTDLKELTYDVIILIFKKELTA